MMENLGERFINLIESETSLERILNDETGLAIVKTGGIESLLVCFAEVIRSRHYNSAQVHSRAFTVLLHMSQRNQYYLTKFLDELNGLRLAEFILSHPLCKVSELMLNNYLDFCLVKSQTDQYDLIKSPKLIYHLMTSWRAWHKDLETTKLLYTHLTQLLQPIRPDDRDKIEHNYRMLSEAGGISILMDVLRECLVPVDEDVPNINHELIELIVNLITLLIRHPPGLEIMSDIMGFLIFLHPDHNAYVEPYVDQIAYMDHQFRLMRCSNRSFAIANIADMLASIVKLASTDPMGILSEALQRSIIEPKKLIILANNSSHLVREKVLRLFLYCIRACYTLDLKSLLGKYEQDGKNSKFKLNLPIQLMARQLLRYPTTIKMVQLCYGIIVGVDDFESVDRICLRFNIDPANNHLQLNTLVLLIQLTTQLQTYKEIVLTLQFIHAYIKQLLEIGEEATVLNLMKRTLVDSLMKLYFLCAENKVQRDKLLNDRNERFGTVSVSETSSTVESNTEDDDDDNNAKKKVLYSSETNERRRIPDKVKEELLSEDDEDEEDSLDGLSGWLLWELDRFLILITCTYLQYLPTNEAIKSIGGLVLYFNSLNFHVPARYQDILRDRSVRVLASALHFCRHYEEVGRQRQYGGKFQYYIKSFFKNNQLNNFNNSISDAEFVGIFLGNLYYEKSASNSSTDDDYGDENESVGNGGATITVCGTSLNRSRHRRRRQSSNNFTSSSCSSEQYDNSEDGSETSKQGPREISENEVLERFQATFKFIVDFISTREPDVIPSPLERDFILRSIRTLHRNLSDLRAFSMGSAKQNSHWSMLLPKLERPLRAAFSQLIIYLLSPCDSMNLDERRYFAHRLFSELEVERLLDLLEHDSERSTYILLLTFTKDLLDYTHTAQNSEDETASCEEYDEDYIEIKLRLLIVMLEYELNRPPTTNTALMVAQTTGASTTTTTTNAIDMKIKAVWLADLNQRREDSREASKAFLEEKRANSSSILGDNLVEQPNDTDRLVDEAVSITRDVVNDKHELRKIYLKEVKQKKVYNYHIRQQWLSLIIGHTHERSIWHMKDWYPKSWELNPVEGPSRTRRRLRPCKLTLEPRFVRLNATESPVEQSVALELRQLSPIASATNGKRSTENLEEENEDEGEEGNHHEGYAFEPKDCSSLGEMFEDDWHNLYSPHPLCSLVLNCQRTAMDSNELRIRMFTTDKIHFNCDCSIIRPNEVCEGEVSIASWCIHFIGERSDSYQRHLDSYVNNRMICSQVDSENGGNCVVPPAKLDAMLQSTLTPPPLNRLKTLASSPRAYMATMVEDLWFDEIVEIWDRRYQLQEVGLEIFLTNNMTYLLSFRNNRDREDFKHHLFREQHKMINLQRFNSTSCLKRLTDLWRKGKLTNFDYLTCLNKLAGRSFNDLMQYPVFPFILANYKSDVLDLTKAENFRKLNKPMAIQREEREEVFKNNYQLSQANLTTGPLGLTKPYHYGNHYSNSATVLHFLVRLPPFTQMLIQYQDNNFDQPDRTFHSLANTWQLITRDSNTDFKELIPEFFFLPEMFTNIEGLELGKKQNNELVDDVHLPPWCPHSDARLFTMIHRQALESPYVSENLHHWIDLIFGYKQTGKAAVDAINVFHPATYYGGIDLSSSAQASTSPTSYGGSSGVSGAVSSTFASVGSSLAHLNPSSLVNNCPTISARSSKYDSDYISDTDSPHAQSQQQQQQQKQQQQQNGSTPTDLKHQNNSSAASDISSPRRVLLNNNIQLTNGRQHQQPEIERSALETMIKTYGQMPRQLFSQPMLKRSTNTFASHQNQAQSEKAARQQLFAPGKRTRKLEPLRQIRGLRWGSYVGSPDEGDIVAVGQPKELPRDYEDIERPGSRASSSQRSGPRKGRTNSNHDRFHLCLLANGDVAILQKYTSLMLDYRADRKSNGQAYLLSLPSNVASKQEAKYRAGLSNIARMNLFSNMIISRQQFSFLEPIYSPASQLDSLPLSTLTGTLKARFSRDKLTLVSWNHEDGIIQVKHPATSTQSRTLPLIQTDTMVDKMTTCCSTPELNLLLVGYSSGSICAHIVSTTHEMTKQSRATGDKQSPPPPLDHAAPSAIHFVHTTSAANSGSSELASGRGGGGSKLAANNSASSSVNRLQTAKSSPRLSRGPEPSWSNSSSISTLQGTQASITSITMATSATVSPIKKTSRWLYCHNKKVNCIKINVSFGIVVTGSDDGTSVIWDLNSLTYLRTIDYKTKSLVLKNQSGLSLKQPKFCIADQDYLSWNYGRANTNRLFDYLCRCEMAANETMSWSSPSSSGPTPKRVSQSSSVMHQSKSNTNNNNTNYSSANGARHSSASPYNNHATRCCICCSGISLIAISDTIGDIATVKNFSDRLALTTTGEDSTGETTSNSEATSASSSSSSLRASDLTVNLTSVIYVHTINGSLVGYINCYTQVTALCYSNAPEGVSVNVIVVGMSGGLVRLYSSWDLCRVREFRISDMDSPVSSILYSRDSQLLYIVYDDDRMVVLKNEKKPVSQPKELVIVCNKDDESN